MIYIIYLSPSSLFERPLVFSHCGCVQTLECNKDLQFGTQFYALHLAFIFLLMRILCIFRLYLCSNFWSKLRHTNICKLSPRLNFESVKIFLKQNLGPMLSQKSHQELQCALSCFILGCQNLCWSSLSWLLLTLEILNHQQKRKHKQTSGAAWKCLFKLKYIKDVDVEHFRSVQGSRSLQRFAFRHSLQSQREFVS